MRLKTNNCSFLIDYVLEWPLTIHFRAIKFMRFDFYTPEEIGNVLGLRLKQHRLRQDLTQAQLAEAAGVGISTIARIEAGQGGAFDNIIRIALALGLINDFSDLFECSPQTIDDVIARQNPRQRASGMGG